MSGNTDHSDANPAYINTGAFNATKLSGLAAALTAFGGAVVGIVKAAGVAISEAIMIAVLGAVAIALIALAVVVAADVLARSRVKCCAIRAGVGNGMPSAEQAAAVGVNGSNGDALLTVGSTRIAIHEPRSVHVV
ncbi:MAG: hypothetical protein ACTHOE_15715 [Conexibacter sp.]